MNKLCFFTPHVIFCIFQLLSAFAQKGEKAQYSYFQKFSFTDTASVKLKGSVDAIRIDAKTEKNVTSITSLLELKRHNINQHKGTDTMLVMSLD